MTIAIIVGTGILVVYAGILLLIWRYQERIVFQPPAGESLDRLPPGVRKLTYESEDGHALFSLAVGPERARVTILAFHGNAMVARWMLPWAGEVSRRLGALVVLPEYRGYDGLRGTPSHSGAARDADAALNAIRNQLGVDPRGVVLYGHSLGTAVATELASSAEPRAIVLESPFSSARAMARRWPLVGLDALWDHMARVHYDTVGRVAGLDVPVHVAHGERDLIVPARMGREVFEAARVKGALLLLPDAGHNDVPAVGGRQYWAWLANAAGVNLQ